MCNCGCLSQLKKFWWKTQFELNMWTFLAVNVRAVIQTNKTSTPQKINWKQKYEVDHRYFNVTAPKCVRMDLSGFVQVVFSSLNYFLQMSLLQKNMELFLSQMVGQESWTVVWTWTWPAFEKFSILKAITVQKWLHFFSLFVLE